MISPDVFTSFSLEAQKTAAHPYLHAGLGAAGAGLAGWQAAKYFHPDQKLERRMMEMGEMDQKLFRKRSRRRVAQVGAVAALGGAAGALSPFAAEAAYRAGKRKLQGVAEGMGRRAQEAVGGAAHEAGRQAAKGVKEEAKDTFRFRWPWQRSPS